MNPDNLYELASITVDLRTVAFAPPVLDIGGGGEGIVGQHTGSRVVAIDICKDELEEAPDGPVKLVMDATAMTFLDNTFQTATAFFTLMYVNDRAVQLQMLKEARRVLKPQGFLHIWDVDLHERPSTDKPLYLVRVRCRLPAGTVETGYGNPWPAETRDKAYYIALAEEAGMHPHTTERLGHAFYLRLQKT